MLIQGRLMYSQRRKIIHLYNSGRRFHGAQKIKTDSKSNFKYYIVFMAEIYALLATLEFKLFLFKERLA